MINYVLEVKYCVVIKRGNERNFFIWEYYNYSKIVYFCMVDKFIFFEVYFDLYFLIISKNLVFLKFVIILFILLIFINVWCIDILRGIICFDLVIRDNGGFYYYVLFYFLIWILKFLFFFWYFFCICCFVCCYNNY